MPRIIRRRLENCLDLHSIKHDRHCTYARLKELVRRAERGLLPYTNCSVQELFRFVRSRGLLVFVTERDVEDAYGKQRLIARLEHADDHAVFRFLDLPPELRNIIYELVLLQRDSTLSPSRHQTATSQEIDPVTGPETRSSSASWKDLRATLAIVQTSSTVRREALPLFYAVNTFLFSMNAGMREPYNLASSGARRNAAQIWLKRVIGTQVHNIRHLRFHISNHRCQAVPSSSTHAPHEKCTMRLHVDFDASALWVRHADGSMIEGESCSHCRKGSIAVHQIKDVCNRALRVDGTPRLSLRLMDALLRVCAWTEW